MAFRVETNPNDSNYPNYIDKILNVLSYPKFYHTFLIRNPYKVGVSYYKAFIKNMNDVTNENDELITPLGFIQILNFYNKRIELEYNNLIIVDSDDLLAKPKDIMKKYCTIVGMYYSDNIINWNNNDSSKDEILAHFNDVWEGWHDDMLKSNGISMKSKQELEKERLSAIKYSNENLPKILLNEIKQHINAYHMS